MSYFNFPTWAITVLADKLTETAKVAPMPQPSLDEIDAMRQLEQKPERKKPGPKPKIKEGGK
jgi:hypothetical protein